MAAAVAITAAALSAAGFGRPIAAVLSMDTVRDIAQETMLPMDAAVTAGAKAAVTADVPLSCKKEQVSYACSFLSHAVIR